MINTEGNLRLQDNKNAPKNTDEVNCNANIDGERSIFDKNKNKQRRNRELEVLADSQIINARLRSDSGKVYSTSLTVSSDGQDRSVLDVVSEEEDIEGAEVEIDAEMCLKGDCCKNTSKIIDMISKLQSSVDDVLKKSSMQEATTAENKQRVEELEVKCGKNTEDVEELVDELKETKFQLKLITNTVIKQDQQISFLKQKITEIQHREMVSNIIISGIEERKNEKPIQIFNEVVAKQLEMQELIPANKAFRLGSGVNRPLLVELRNPEYKRKLYANATKLKGKTNSAGNFFFISDHLPDEMNEDR